MGAVERGCPVRVGLGAAEVVGCADALETAAGAVGDGLRAEPFARGEAAGKRLAECSSG